jgi:hypothetical protein
MSSTLGHMESRPGQGKDVSEKEDQDKGTRPATSSTITLAQPAFEMNKQGEFTENASISLIERQDPAENSEAQLSSCNAELQEVGPTQLVPKEISLAKAKGGEAEEGISALGSQVTLSELAIESPRQTIERLTGVCDRQISKHHDKYFVVRSRSSASDLEGHVQQLYREHTIQTPKVSRSDDRNSKKPPLYNFKVKQPRPPIIVHEDK